MLQTESVIFLHTFVDTFNRLVMPRSPGIGSLIATEFLTVNPDTTNIAKEGSLNSFEYTVNFSTLLFRNLRS